MRNITRHEHPARLGRIQIAFLAALIYNLVALVTWFLYSYVSSMQCVLGPFCGFNQFSGFLQFVFIVMSMALTWLIVAGALRIVAWFGMGSVLQYRLDSWMKFRDLQGPMMAFGGLLLTLMFLTVVLGRASMPVLVYGLGTSVLLFLAARAGIQASDSAAQPILPGSQRATVAPPPSPQVMAEDATPTAASTAAATDANATPPPF